MHSRSSTKVATGHLKRTKGTFLNEAHKFKTSDDPDNPCSGLETHFKKHEMDTVACRAKSKDMSKMVSVFTAHPLFTVDNMRALLQKVLIIQGLCLKSWDIHKRAPLKSMLTSQQ